MYKAFILIGVSGSGKTTIGKLLADKTGMEFFDADDFHPPENLAKMAAGIPLNTKDRLPWLKTLNLLLWKEIKTSNTVLACSALRETYRQLLGAGIENNCNYIHLSGDYETIANRLEKRRNHYMKPQLLQSQYDTLELPKNALTVDIKQSPAHIVAFIMDNFQMK